MPIGFDMEKLRKKHKCKNYFETGMYDVREREDVSIKVALKCKFKKVFSIEIREDWVEIGKQVLTDEIKSGKCVVIHDDSTNMKKYLGHETFKGKTMFFLDAHVDNNNIHNYKYRCPLFDEIEAIGSLERKDNLILVDDIRIIKDSFPWGETSFGSVDFLEKIVEKILSINKDYKFTLLEGVIPNDVLLAYVDE